MHYIVFTDNKYGGDLNSDLFTLLLYGCGNNLLQIFSGLLSPLVNELGFAFSLFQLALNGGDLIWRQLAPVFLQKLFGTGDDLIQGAGVCQYIVLQNLEIRHKAGGRVGSWNKIDFN